MTDSPLLVDDRQDAVFSDCRDYRYRLRRTWDRSLPDVAFILLNPSTATETEDDPTIRRCIGYAKEWGYGTLHVVNLFAIRSPKPSVMKAHESPIEPLDELHTNDYHIREVCEPEGVLTVAAWGNHGAHLGRAAEVVDMLDTDLFALDVTDAGQPGHPIYLPKDADLSPFDYRGDDD